MKIIKKADLEQTRAAMIETINTTAEQAAAEFITQTSLAQYMYQLKAQEVKKFHRYGNEDDMPLLSQEAILRDITVPQLVQEIEQKQTACNEALQAIELTRQQALIAINQAKTITDLHQITKVDRSKPEENTKTVLAR